MVRDDDSDFHARSDAAPSMRDQVRVTIDATAAAVSGPASREATRLQLHHTDRMRLSTRAGTGAATGPARRW